LGILFLELVCGKCYYEGNDPYQLYHAIVKEDIIIPKCVDKFIKKVIQALLIKDS